jgi:uncharacterized protein YecT (DUF1311 family)
MCLLAVLCLALYGHGQQNQPAHHKVLTPEQQTYQQELKLYSARQQRLQVQAKQIFDAEMAREKTDDCPDAVSTYELRVCYGKQLDTTEANLKNFEATIHDLLAPAPQMPGEPATLPPGPAGPNLTSAQLTAEFESVERIWRQYRDTACTAAFHQYGGGTLGPIVELECNLRFARNHMRELKSVYGFGPDH